MRERRSIRHALQTFGNITELYEVKTYTGYRNGKRVTVQILDQGMECPNPDSRFACQVIEEDGKRASGNNARTTDEAIAIVHWRDLD